MKIPGLATAQRGIWQLAMSPIVPNLRRNAALSRLGLHGVHPSVLISDGVVFAPPRDVSIGEGSFLNRQVFVDGHGVHLGQDVFVGPRAMFLTTAHEIGHESCRAAPGVPSPIYEGDGTWIGAGVTVLPGVTIGPGCVIGAGAVVAKDCEPNGLYVGVPASRIRDLPIGSESERGDG